MFESLNVVMNSRYEQRLRHSKEHLIAISLCGEMRSFDHGQEGRECCQREEWGALPSLKRVCSTGTRLLQHQQHGRRKCFPHSKQPPADSPCACPLFLPHHPTDPR